MIFTMLNFLKERHKHNFEDVIWFDCRYYTCHELYVYRAKCCSCGKIKDKRIIYQGGFSSYGNRQEKIDWWVSQGAITEEEFALKYR